MEFLILDFEGHSNLYIHARCLELVNSWHVKMMNNMFKHHLCLTRVKKLIKAINQY